MNSRLYHYEARLNEHIPSIISSTSYMLMTIPITTILLLLIHTTPIICIRSIHMRWHHAAMSSHFLVLQLNEALRSLLGNGFFVAENKQRCFADENAVNVFECSARGFRVEEIYCGKLKCAWGRGQKWE
jgi:hypothetical protein